MPTCVPIKDLRDTVAFSQLVENAPEPITVTRNGYDQFVCMRSAEYQRLTQAEARANLMARIAISERERSAGLSTDAFEDIAAARTLYGL